MRATEKILLASLAGEREVERERKRRWEREREKRE